MLIETTVKDHKKDKKVLIYIPQVIVNMMVSTEAFENTIKDLSSEEDLTSYIDEVIEEYLEELGIPIIH